MKASVEKVLIYADPAISHNEHDSASGQPKQQLLSSDSLTASTEMQQAAQSTLLNDFLLSENLFLHIFICFLRQ